MGAHSGGGSRQSDGNWRCRLLQAKSTTEKPDANLLSNMEMGDAAGWANGSSDAVNAAQPGAAAPGEPAPPPSEALPPVRSRAGQ